MDRAPDAFVAPRAPGTPSPDAMRRLQAAVSKVPDSSPAPRRQPMSAQRPLGEPEKPRFGINALINRMTGHAQAPAADHRLQPQPRPQSHAAETDPDQEKIEIPAFLRRQAN